MTKTKKLYLLVFSFFFLSVFFGGVDEVKADCYDECANQKYPQTCFDNCESSPSGLAACLPGEYGSAVTGCFATLFEYCVNAGGNDPATCGESTSGNAAGTISLPFPTISCPSSEHKAAYAATPDECVCMTGYHMNSVGQSCLVDTATTGGGSTQYDICLNNPFSMPSDCAGLAGDNTENACNNACPDADCVDGTCVLVGGSDYTQCINEGGTIDDCARFDDGSHCATNSECIIDYGAGYVCDQATRLCEERAADVTVTTANGDVCYTDSECNWYSKCKLGNNAATGVCQGYLNFSDPQAALNALGLPDGSKIDSSGILTSADGTKKQLTAAQIAQIQASNGVTNGNSDVNYVGSIGCGAGFYPIGGVCFPARTGLANPAGGIAAILRNLFNWMMGIFVTLAVAAFVVSGIQYLLGSGSEDMVDAAKKNATNALIGIIVGLSGFIIVQAISAALSATGINF